MNTNVTFAPALASCLDPASPESCCVRERPAAGHLPTGYVYAHEHMARMGAALAGEGRTRNRLSLQHTYAARTMRGVAAELTTCRSGKPGSVELADRDRARS